MTRSTLVSPAVLLWAALAAEPPIDVRGWEKHPRVAEVRGLVKKLDASSTKVERIDLSAKGAYRGEPFLEKSLTIETMRLECLPGAKCTRVHAVYSSTVENADVPPTDKVDLWVYSVGGKRIFAFEKATHHSLMAQASERRWYFDANGDPWWMVERREGVFEGERVKDTRYFGRSPGPSISALGDRRPPSVCDLGVLVHPAFNCDEAPAAGYLNPPVP